MELVEEHDDEKRRRREKEVGARARQATLSPSPQEEGIQLAVTVLYVSDQHL